jgi:hypothetical protein
MALQGLPEQKNIAFLPIMVQGEGQLLVHLQGGI